jgi:hypothetical protein
MMGNFRKQTKCFGTDIRFIKVMIAGFTKTLGNI